MNDLNPDESQLAFIWMLIMLAYIIVPFESIFEHLIKIDTEKWEKKNSVETFEEIAETFIDDFDRTNPVTVHEGWEWLGNLMKKKGLIDDEKLENIKMKNENKTSGILQNMQNYASTRKNVDKLESKKFGTGLVKKLSKGPQRQKTVHKQPQDSHIDDIKNMLHQNHFRAQRKKYEIHHSKKKGYAPVVPIDNKIALVTGRALNERNEKDKIDNNLIPSYNSPTPGFTINNPNSTEHHQERNHESSVGIIVECPLQVINTQYSHDYEGNPNPQQYPNNVNPQQYPNNAYPPQYPNNSYPPQSSSNLHPSSFAPPYHHNPQKIHYYSSQHWQWLDLKFSLTI